MRTAVATFGFGRPDHFERMLRSLGSCPEVVNGTVDVVHYLDGGPGSEQEALRNVIESSGVPYASIVARPENLGVGRQLIGARRELLDEQGYDRMVLVEDDIELSPTYLTSLLNLSDWAGAYADVGTVQVWNVEAGSKEELQPHLHQVELTNRHFVTYCLTKRAWDIIKPVLYAYEEKFLMRRPLRKTTPLPHPPIHATTTQASPTNAPGASIGPASSSDSQPLSYDTLAFSANESGRHHLIGDVFGRSPSHHHSGLSRLLLRRDRGSLHARGLRIHGLQRPRLVAVGYSARAV